MKTLFKLLVLIVILAVFAFSSNPTISKVRNYVVKEGKILYSKGINALESSDNTTAKNAGEKLQ